MRKEAAAPSADGLKMLARQQLGRRHQCRLGAGLDRRRHRQERDDGLPAADIALEQAEHAAGARETTASIRRARVFARRWSKGQGGDDRFAQLSRRGKSPSGASLEPGADHRKRKLVREKLIVSEPRPSRCRRRRSASVAGACSRAIASPKPGHAFWARKPPSIHSGRSGICASAFATALRKVVGEPGGQRIDRLVQG